MHRIYILAVGLLVGGVGVYTLQLGTPGGVAEPELVALDRPNLFSDDDIDFTLTAVEAPLDTEIQVTRGSPIADDAARVDAIISFLNRRQDEPALEILAVHKVIPGDSLATIAERYYGNSAAAKHIYLANRYNLTAAHQIKVGQSLRIPVLSGL